MAQVERPKDGETEEISQKIDAYIAFIQQADHLLSELATQAKEMPAVKNKLIGMTIAHAAALFYEVLPNDFGRTTEDAVYLFASLLDQWGIQQLRAIPYADYLLSKHWLETRQKALERATYRCQVCNSNATLNVHHRTYERRGYERDEDLVVLCQSCHQLFHDNGKLQVAE